MKPFSPMLASAITPEQLNDLKYPCILQPKFDGIRCCIVNGHILTRALKHLPNKWTRNCLREWIFSLKKLPYLIDGELTVNGSFQDVQSAFMTEEGIPDFEYNMFDWAQTQSDLERGYSFRFEDSDDFNGSTNKVNSITCISPEDVLFQESMLLDKGYEGIIIRPVLGRYKFGRSTINEGNLLKLKRFEDAEARIIGFVEQEINNNPQELNGLGMSVRSSHQAGMIKGDMLGALRVIGINGQFKDIEFNIGSGFDNLDRKNIWINQSEFLSQIVTYKYQRIGSKDKPRQPIFKGLRKD